jgi:hypothetical protein
MEFFEPSAPPPGTSASGCRSTISVEVSGWTPSSPACCGAATVHTATTARRRGGCLCDPVRARGARLLHRSARGAEFNPIWIACDGTACATWATAWRAGSTRVPPGAVLARPRNYEPEERAIEKLPPCLVAWSAAERGGALVHGASAGARREGLCVLRRVGGRQVHAVVGGPARADRQRRSVAPAPATGRRPRSGGSPFRGTYEGGAPVLGRTPLARRFGSCRTRSLPSGPRRG